MKEKGQALLILLLVMSVVLTVGLSIVSRSVTDVKISQQSQESARSFWVAQAGLESAIKANASISETTLNNIAYSVTKAGLGGGMEFVFPEKVGADQPMTLWLIDHNAETGALSPPAVYSGPDQISFFWGESENPIMEAFLVYKNAAGNFLTRRYVYETDPARSPATNFTAARTTGCSSVSGQAFSFCTPSAIVLPANTIPYFIRLKLLFNSQPQPIGISANKNLPQQGSCYTSTASVSESGITTKLNQCQLWQTSPFIFDNGLFSEGGIN